MTLFTEYGFILILLAALFGFFMAWGIGANDVANAMGTSVGSRALTIKQALIVAVVFEFSGAYLAGGQVTSTIRKGIVDITAFESTPELLVFGMLASLIAAGAWLIIASWRGWPVSTTHSIVGAIVGFAAVGLGTEAVQWGKVVEIVGSWVITPAISGLIAFGIFVSAQKLIFDTADPIARAKKWVPVYMFLCGFVMSLVTITKGLKHVGLDMTGTQSFFVSLGVGLVVLVIGSVVVGKMQENDEVDDRGFGSLERTFAVLMIVTACSMAFAHGSNDVANAIGPLAAVVSVVQSGGELASKAALAWWILPLGAIGIVVGLAMLGARVIRTVGQRITELTPSRGFAAEMATASTVILASGTGLPISTTQTLVGAVLGVGMARGIAALNLGVVRNIVISWIITLPIGAGLSILFFYIIRSIFG
ncbi:inorganic phosphate transporter [Alteromonadaceae bacterium M269]|nr:inorganic phosphate transporter [Alteromonadaceae bacterium M269]